MATSRRRHDERAAEYVDSPLMRMRIRDGQRLVARTDGHYGCYRREVHLADRGRDSCTCPSEPWPCKHVRALRKTWRVRPRSFLDLSGFLDEVARGGRAALVSAIRAIALAHPESLGALGLPAFAPDGDDRGDDDGSGDNRPGSAPVPGRPITRRFTALQGRYLACIHYYTELHGLPPAESDLQRYFRVSPPSVHRMILALERCGLIRRRPGQARSIRVLLGPDEIPDLAQATPP